MNLRKFAEEYLERVAIMDYDGKVQDAESKAYYFMTKKLSKEEKAKLPKKDRMIMFERKMRGKK